MILGIDASAPGSGGAKRHLIEILKNTNPLDFGFYEVKIWGVESLLDELPNKKWLTKLSHPYLNKNLFYRIIWQIFYRDNSFKFNKINILFCPFGTYIGSFKPFITMSQNMLIFDVNEKRRFPLISTIRFKLNILFYIQSISFKKASGVIFISHYAQDKINKILNLNPNFQKVIYHGVSEQFNKIPKKIEEIIPNQKKITILYVSTIWVYKHPLNVIEAIKNLVNKGFNLDFILVGNPEEKVTSNKLQKLLQNKDYSKYITWFKNVSLNEVSKFYKSSDIFIFASTCENMPNILIEAMSSGLPIACSNYYPMPEFLEDAGIYFDPLNISSIEDALKKLIIDQNLRRNLSIKSYELSKKYNWEKCSNETFNFIKYISNTNFN
jgi:glycosyltransferase involved in cell wall biosynthesis